VKIKMPRGDRTGPYGDGPMSGRGAGYCAGSPYPGYVGAYGRGRGPGYGRGRGPGRGRRFGGRGMRNPRGFLRHRFWGRPLSEEEELRFLKEQEKILKEEEKGIEGLISELEGE
jgi:hypothetical protein